MPRTPLTFTAHQDMLTSTILEEDAAELQEQYLKNTNKPFKLGVKEWIKRMQTINSYLPSMKTGRQRMTEQNLIKWCIAPNLPPRWPEKFALADGPYLTNMLVVLRRLKVIEERDRQENDNQ
eukprot:11166290-Ditylum_brightwellii.AAC.1